jgi:endonuclease YncB( thermonuclease family)
MFHTLHRVYVVGWLTLVIAGALWLYPRSGIAEPLNDWYGVWQNAQGKRTQPVAHLSGTAVWILDSTSFTLRGSDRQLYSIGLLGVVSPAALPRPSDAQLETARLAKTRLSELILSNQVDIALTWMDPQRRGVGEVWVGSTNVNAALVQSGLLQLKREFIKGIPLRDQYTLIRADRLAKAGKEPRRE